MNNYKLGENLPVYYFKFHNLISSGLAGTNISEPSWLFLTDLYQIVSDLVFPYILINFGFCIDGLNELLCILLVNQSISSCEIIIIFFNSVSNIIYNCLTNSYNLRGR